MILALLKTKIGAYTLIAIIAGYTALFAYNYYLSSKLQYTALQNKQYKKDLNAWQLSYTSLIDEFKKSEEISKSLRNNLKSIRKKASVRRKEFSKINGDTDVKKWSATAIPANVIKFMRDAKKSSSSDDRTTKTPRATNG